MAYCRFLDSDAYIYDDVVYGLYCCVCSLGEARIEYNDFFKMDMTVGTGFIAGDDYDKMLSHIADHRAAGDYIPEDVDEELIKERDCEHTWIDADLGIRCEKCWRSRND